MSRQSIDWSGWSVVACGGGAGVITGAYVAQSAHGFLSFAVGAGVTVLVAWGIVMAKPDVTRPSTIAFLRRMLIDRGALGLAGLFAGLLPGTVVGSVGTDLKWRAMATAAATAGAIWITYLLFSLFVARMSRVRALSRSRFTQGSVVWGAFVGAWIFCPIGVLVMTALAYTHGSWDSLFSPDLIALTVAGMVLLLLATWAAFFIVGQIISGIWTFLRWMDDRIGGDRRTPPDPG